MKIKVYNIQQAPAWVQYLNIINLFLLGFAIGNILDHGLSWNLIHFFTLYGSFYGFVIGQFFIPKKEIAFPLGIYQHLKEQWSVN